ncbi:hypothetical protein QE152_g38200 [Popillia japonica]|uniref:Uncharacterized protein n=1 Tax=Popillia japonica TaxID=7064 RepID=A0AAW1I8I3_POPJA
MAKIIGNQLKKYQKQAGRIYLEQIFTLPHKVFLAGSYSEQFSVGRGLRQQDQICMIKSASLIDHNKVEYSAYACQDRLLGLWQVTTGFDLDSRQVDRISALFLRLCRCLGSILWLCFHKIRGEF